MSRTCRMFQEGVSVSRSVTIFGPSNTFRSGISYYIRRLGQALQYEGGIPVRFALFKDMLPKFLFPGKTRVERFSDSFIPFPYSTIDWWNPVSYIASILKASRSDSIVFEWWTGAVGLQYILAALLLRRKNTILEYHECIDPSENRRPCNCGRGDACGSCHDSSSKECFILSGNWKRVPGHSSLESVISFRTESSRPAS